MPTEETQNIQLPDFPNSAYLAQIINAAFSIFLKIANALRAKPATSSAMGKASAGLRIQGVVSNLSIPWATGGDQIRHA